MSKDALKEFLPEQIVEFFEYLDALRQAGFTNMYGASPWLKREFIMDDDDARAVLGAWMETFSHDKNPKERVKEALS